MDAFTLTARLILNKSEFDASYKNIEGDLGSAESRSRSATGALRWAVWHPRRS